MEKNVLEYIIKLIGPFENPNYKHIAENTTIYCNNNGVVCDVSVASVKNIHETIKRFGSHDEALQSLLTMRDSDVGVQNDDSNSQQTLGFLNEKANEAEMMKELHQVIYDAANTFNRINDYCIVKGKTRYELQTNVRDKMSLGWKPYGGVAAAAFGISPVGGNSYVQAMVKFS